MENMDKVFEGYGGYDGWLMYAETHYLPALCRAITCGDTCPLSTQDRSRLVFLHDDIVQMINERGLE